MDPRLVADIKGSEGYKLTAYRDSLGYWTIGYGHLLPDQTKDWYGYTITQAQADTYLDQDLTQAQARCMHLVEWPSLDTPCRQNAVIELEFNMAGKWIKFYKTRLDIGNQDWKAAHDDLLNSLWAKQVGSTRSNRIANYLLTGQYP
jgi:lysozyme